MPIRRFSAPLPLSASPATLLLSGAASGDHMKTYPHVASPAPSLPPLPSSPFSSPPPLLPLPHLMQWNPTSYSSSSSLSALAPPFTLGHASSGLYPPLQMPPYTPDPLLSGDFPAFARLPPHNEVAKSLPPLSDSYPPGDSDFADCFRDAELHPELRPKALGNTVEPTIYSRFAAPSGAGSDAATLVEPFYSLYYPDSQRWNFGPLSAYYNNRTSLLIDGKVSPAKRSDEVPLTEVSRPPFGYKAPSFLEDLPSTSQLPPYDNMADSFPSGSINAPFGHSCYGHYCNDSELRVLDDKFGPSSAHSKVGVAQWNKPSDEDVVSVKLPDELPGTGPPSSSRKLFFHGGKEHFGCQSTEWLLDDHPLEKYKREHDSASSYTIFNPQLSTSAMGLNDTYVSGSAYDRYMTQLDSCSVYPEFYYPFAKGSASNEVYLPSNFTASANINPSLSFGKVHHEVLHMVDDASVIPSRSREANLNESMDPKGEYNEKRWEDYHTTNSNVLPAVSRRDFPSSNNHATECPSNLLSMLTSKLRPGNMVIADSVSSPSTCNSFDLNVSTMSSSEAFDQHSLSVDSPCWKGAPASQQSLFTSDRNLVERELVKNHSCHEPNNSAEQVGNLNFDEVKKSHVSEKPECSPVVSSNMQQILEFSENKMSDCRKDKENESLFDYVHEEQINQTTEAKKRVDAQHVFAANFVEMESNAPNEFPPPKGIAKNIEGPSSAPLRKLEELVKLIHGSSVELLSTNCSEAEGLKPHDCKLLYATISNISLLLKDKDIVGCSSLEAACSENMSSRNQKTISGCDYFDDDFGNLVIQGGEAYVSKVGKKMMQTFENAVSRSFTESEESKQASLYKNLWVQAELLACRLKQELVIAQMKIESENHEPPQSGMSSSLNSLHSLKVHDSPLKAKDTESIREEEEDQLSASANHESSKAEDVESSVMSRFQILKDRNNKSIHRDVELEYILDKEHAAMHPVVNAMTANLANTRFSAAVANDQVSPSLDVSGYGNTRQTLSGPLYGPLIQSYMTYKQGSCPSRSRDDELSFEWVHVMGEDESTH